MQEIPHIQKISPTFETTIAQLSGEPRDRSIRVASFIRDLQLTLDPILSMLRANSIISSRK